RRRRRSSVAFPGMTQVSGYPFSFASSASEMPVLPLVGSSSSRPGWSSPAASAASSIAFATRSLIEPVGFWPSSFAYSRTPGFGETRRSSTSGVLPIRSSSEEATIALRTAGHCWQEDHGRVVLDGRVQPFERAHVLALEVHVHEGRDRVVLDELRAQSREPIHQVVQELAHGAASGVNLARAVRLGAQ